VNAAGVRFRGATAARRPATPRAVVMAVLGGLFLLRVIGQVLVTYAGVGWLPAVEHWQSGLLAYPALLASQGVILVLLALVTADVWRGRGRFARPRPRVASALGWVGAIYLASMIVRYVATMLARPEWRWFGHSIPVLFHLVLATFLLVYAGVPSGEGAAPQRGQPRPRSRGAPVDGAEPRRSPLRRQR
jgi:hypothetical protein